MRKTTAKFALSIPIDLYEAVARTRKTTGKSRSAVIRDALRAWLSRQAHAAMAHEDEAAYRRKPEGRREIKAAQAAAVRLLSGERWP